MWVAIIGLAKKRGSFIQNSLVAKKEGEFFIQNSLS